MFNLLALCKFCAFSAPLKIFKAGEIFHANILSFPDNVLTTARPTNHFSFFSQDNSGPGDTGREPAECSGAATHPSQAPLLFLWRHQVLLRVSARGLCLHPDPASAPTLRLQSARSHPGDPGGPLRARPAGAHQEQARGRGVALL